MDEDSKTHLAGWLIAAVAIMVAASLLFAGFVAGEPVRLIIQTLPLWVVIVFGLMGSGYVRWAAFPVLLFWSALAAILWLEHMGWIHAAGGGYTAVELRVAGLVAAADGTLESGIYDMMGRLVRTLPATPVREGEEYTLTMDLGEMAAGTYTVHAAVGSYQATVKFSVVR